MHGVDELVDHLVHHLRRRAGGVHRTDDLTHVVTTFQSECQARHITGCLVAMAERGARRVEVTPAAHDADVAATDAAHERMIWTHPGMDTYYRNRHGRVITEMPWRLVDYWSRTHDPDPDAYHWT